MFKKNIRTPENKPMNRASTRQELNQKMTLIKNFNQTESKSSLVLHLPSDASQLTELTELEICDKDFEELPDLLSLLKDLKKLIIHNNVLKSLPSVIGTLQNLCIINLSHNQLTQLPNEISKLRNLEELDLSFNQLENLPSSCSQLQRLRVLNISNNTFKRLPKCVQYGMGTLRILNISENPKVEINVTPYSKYLERFCASRNQNCCKFPDWLLKHKFFNLKEFELNETTFDIFNFIGNEGKLYYTSISMKCSNLSNPILEMIIENMANLEIINVGNDKASNSANVFSNIPINTLRNPGLITELNFCATSLSVLPLQIKLLQNLKKLDISLNSISWFPEEFCELLKLEILKMDGNDFILFPENFGNLISLKELQAQNNTLSKLPQSFKNLKNLKIIDMYNNMFEEFPNVILEMGSLEGLDFDQNFCSTNEIMIGQLSYSILRISYIELMKGKADKNLGFRISGNKIRLLAMDCSSDSEELYKVYGGSGYSSDSDNRESTNIDFEEAGNSTDENWEFMEDSDDNYKPSDIKVSQQYEEKSPTFLPPIPGTFCPADWHSKRVKAEVKSMRIHGSLTSSTEIVHGQFDDI